MIPGLSAIPGILGYFDRGAATPRRSQDDPGTVCYSGYPGKLMEVPGHPYGSWDFMDMSWRLWTWMKTRPETSLI